MNFAGLRPISFALLLILFAGAGCNRPKQASSKSSVSPTPQGVRAGITIQTPDAFYDPPRDVPSNPGALLRSEPLKDVILPAGVRGWRILYATTVDDNTPATAVATVFAPTDLLCSSLFLTTISSVVFSSRSELPKPDLLLVHLVLHEICRKVTRGIASPFGASYQIATTDLGADVATVSASAPEYSSVSE